MPYDRTPDFLEITKIMFLNNWDFYETKANNNCIRSKIVLLKKGEKGGG